MNVLQQSKVWSFCLLCNSQVFLWVFVLFFGFFYGLSKENWQPENFLSFSVLSLGGNKLVKGGDLRPQPTVLHTGEGNSSSFERCKTKLSLRDLISVKNVSFLLYL